MKIRTGFVSNSSSSSFIVGYKGNKPTKEDLIKKFGTPKGAPFYSVSVMIADFLIRKMNKNNKMTKGKLIKEFWDDDMKAATDEEIIQYLKKETHFPLNVIIDKIFSGEYTFYEEYADDQESGIEQMICNMEFDIQQEDFIFIKEEGY